MEEQNTNTQNNNHQSTNSSEVSTPRSKEDGKMGKRKNRNKNNKGGDSSGTGKYKCHGKYNHPEFYLLDNAQAIDIASYPNGSPVGDRIKTLGSVLGDGAELYLPGICVLHYVPSIPGMDAWQQAVSRFNTGVRSLNSRSTTYTANDLEMSQVCMASAYAFMHYIRRHFGMINSYSYKNRYLVRPLVESLGCDYDDLIDNLSKYRDKYNQLVRDLNSVLFLKGFTLYDRWSFLNDNIFSDTDSPKTQYYMFKPKNVWKWSAIAVQNGSSAQPVSIPDVYKLNDLIEITKSLILELQNDDDITYMLADIAKAYPSSDIINLTTVTPFEVVTVVGESNIYDQIANAIMLPIESSRVIPTDQVNQAEMQFYPLNNLGNYVSDSATGDIKGMANGLVRFAGVDKAILTSNDKEMSAVDIVVKTRLMAECNLEWSPTEGSFTVLSDRANAYWGSEIICFVDYFNSPDETRIGQGSHYRFFMNLFTVKIEHMTTSTEPNEYVWDDSLEANLYSSTDVQFMNAFRFHPVVFTPNKNYPRLDLSLGSPYREYLTDNYIPIGRLGMKSMNESISYAMLNPMIPVKSAMKSLK